jgi:Nucleotidyltransferase
VRNAAGYEVELRIPKSLEGMLPRNEPLAPIGLPEQDWLLPGRRVEHVVCGLDGVPARLVVADPRWFALQKLWLADKPTRNPGVAAMAGYSDLNRGFASRFTPDPK